MAEPPKTNTPPLVDMPRSDRGPTPFFHGRTEELAAFHQALADARLGKTGGGTIFLVQGAPGAGKTALLFECGKQAGAVGWSVADIEGDALYRAGELARKLGLRRPDKTTERTSRGGKIALNLGVEVGMHGAGEETREYPGDSVEHVLQAAAVGRGGVLLLMDEAQNLREEGRIGADVRATLTRNLKRIHNGGMGVPVVLMVGGLGTTQSVMESFGISRFPRLTTHNLGHWIVGPLKA